MKFTKKIVLLFVVMGMVLACGAGSNLPEMTSPASTVARSEVTSTARIESTVTPGVENPYATRPPVNMTPGEVVRDVTYCTMDSVALLMDLYYPASGSGPWPTLIYIHGGGWNSGDRHEIVGLRDLPELTGAGYVVASIDYRLSPEYYFPAMIQDAKCAVRFLRAKADRYGLDAQHIGVWGTSAGGHLAALLGVSDANAGWNVGQWLDQSSRVQAVIVLSGLSDFSLQIPLPNVMQTLFGTTTPSAAQVALVSPVTYVSSDDAPFLIIHGERDWMVPPEQAVRLHASLEAAGVPSQLLLVKNGGHGLMPMGAAIRPTMNEILNTMISFLGALLKGTQ